MPRKWKMSKPLNGGFWAVYLGCLMMSHAGSMHCIFHHKGRGNQQGKEPYFSFTFNTYWETQTT